MVVLAKIEILHPRYVTMDIQVLISKSFPDGLSYNDTAQLCLRLFCSVDGVPEKLHEQCNKEQLAITFSELAKSNFIIGDSVGSIIYGANHHHVIDKGHWIEVIASIFKVGNTADSSIGDELILHITRT
jgi:hypothetical protein